MRETWCSTAVMLAILLLSSCIGAMPVLHPHEGYATQSAGERTHIRLAHHTSQILHDHVARAAANSSGSSSGSSIYDLSTLSIQTKIMAKQWAVAIVGVAESIAFIMMIVYLIKSRRLDKELSRIESGSTGVRQVQTTQVQRVIK
jgi:hypothetical protein